MKRFVLTLSVVCILIAGCNPQRRPSSTADAKQQRATAQRLAEADKQIGMPDITRYQERKLAKDILELRDKEFTTYCYVINRDGDLRFLGEAIGYGIPYSVQFTNPEKVLIEQNGHTAGDIPYTVPQADPNGLFMPQGLSATWLMMIDDKTGQARPVYVEPEILVSPFPLH